jgi:hypothetical protein
MYKYQYEYMHSDGKGDERGMLLRNEGPGRTSRRREGSKKLHHGERRTLNITGKYSDGESRGLPRERKVTSKTVGFLSRGDLLTTLKEEYGDGIVHSVRRGEGITKREFDIRGQGGIEV